MIELIGCVLLLIPCVIMDLKKRKIPVIYVIVFGVAAIAINLIWKMKSPLEIIFGGALGAFFVLVSLIGRNSIGMGDSLTMVSVGVWCGVFDAIVGVFLGFLAAGIFGVVYMLVQQKGWKSKLPFAPFLSVGVIFTAATSWITGAVV